MQKPEDRAPSAVQLPSDRQSMVFVCIRFALYTALAFAQMLVIRWAALRFGTNGFADNDVVENLEVATLGSAGLVLLVTGISTPAFRGLTLLLGSLAMIGCVRELDELFDRLIPWGGWQLLAAAVAATGVFFVWRYRRGLIGQITALFSHRAFALMWAGSMVAIPFAQMLGQSSFLHKVLGDRYTRGGKRLIEESAEIFGYFLVLIGCLELFVYAWRASRAQRRAE